MFKRVDGRRPRWPGGGRRKWLWLLVEGAVGAVAGSLFGWVCGRLPGAWGTVLVLGVLLAAMVYAGREVWRMTKQLHELRKQLPPED